MEAKGSVSRAQVDDLISLALQLYSGDQLTATRLAQAAHWDLALLRALSSDLVEMAARAKNDSKFDDPDLSRVPDDERDFVVGRRKGYEVLTAIRQVAVEALGLTIDRT